MLRSWASRVEAFAPTTMDQVVELVGQLDSNLGQLCDEVGVRSAVCDIG